MLFSTKQMSTLHQRPEKNLNVKFADKTLKRVSETKLIGIHFDGHLTWNKHSCYYILSTLRKLENFTTFKLRKQLTESLVLSKISFNYFVYHPITKEQTKKLQRVAAANFVYNKYVNMEDINY